MPEFDAHAMYLERRKQQEEIDRFLEKYGDRFIDLRSLKMLSGMLDFVNYFLFSLASWVAFAWLAPIVNYDDRPTWLMWLILGPIFGLTFGGVGAFIAWDVIARPLGEFIFKRQHELAAAAWWPRYLGHDEPEWKARRDYLRSISAQRASDDAAAGTGTETGDE